VEAVDKDCSPKFGDICDYKIESQDQPFDISKEGKFNQIENYIPILGFIWSLTYISSLGTYVVQLIIQSSYSKFIKIVEIGH
jgi:hypothetical protein